MRARESMGSLRLGSLGLIPFVVLLAGCPSSGSNANTNTDSASVNSVAPPFDADSAFALLKTQVAFGPRVPGMAGHQKQLAWMLQYLRSRADTVVEQSWTATTTKGVKLSLTNVFARFNPNAADRVLLVAHWDTRPTANEDPDEHKKNLPIDGANDGASGVAVLMQLASELSKHKPPIGVDLLFVDGEDYGPTGEDMYIGAKYFGANLPGNYKPLYGILIDMVGDQNPVFEVESNSKDLAPEVVDRVWRTAEQIGLGNFFRRTSLGGGIEDDHIALNQSGIRTIDIIDFDYGPGNSYWHTMGDVVEHTSPVGLSAVGKVLLELIARGG